MKVVGDKENLITLQWGRACEDADRFRRGGRAFRWVKLQWGRACEDADSLQPHQRDFVLHVASMGPRL